MRTRSGTTRVSAAAIGAAALLLLTACGGSSGGQTTTSSGAGGSSGGSLVQTRGGSGVLVDKNGHTLYAADQESAGVIKCTGGCVSIWVPLQSAGDKLSATGVPVGKLGTVKRSDGTTQVTFDGMPLYTFTQDTSATSTAGDGVSDSFGGTKFSWHAVTKSGLSSQAPSSGGSDDGGTYKY